MGARMTEERKAVCGVPMCISSGDIDVRGPDDALGIIDIDPRGLCVAHATELDARGMIDCGHGVEIRLGGAR